ncbi:hypothetical protein [Flavobacterium undicola]|uniref:hypothetical protein n=1 Tax=Flavobacterium undicola TaxID=1932779 RepID=UPI0015E20AFD|nr:hypothetical protein [Flavobacterium undicola]MBA0883800.1 hypothetical protein [Flavobacterium undicola]
MAGTIVPGVGGSIIQGLQASAEGKKQARDQAAQEQANQMAQDVGAQIGSYGGTVAGNVIQGATKKILAGASNGVNQASGMVGAQVVDNTIKEWFTKHKSIVLGVLGSVVLFFVFFRKAGNHSRRRR